MRLTVLNPFDKDQPFPDAEQALCEPDGLLAIGGCLSPERLIRAYRNGIFPWYNAGEPILWWSPDPRLVLRPNAVKISRSLARVMKSGQFRISFDENFDKVIDGCAQVRKDAPGTWITPEIKNAYKTLHRLGFAHSIEAWESTELAGGLYGVALGRVFFGESMFHRRSNASKAAFVKLCLWLQTWNYALIDCQVRTEHLMSLGAEAISRKEFLSLLKSLCDQRPTADAWLASKPAPP